jgi:hypothetical protein
MRSRAGSSHERIADSIRRPGILHEYPRILIS